MASASSSVRVQSPSTHTPVATAKISPTKTCYSGFHWTHFITIPASLTGIGAAAYGFFASSYILGGIGAMGGLASIVGAIGISVLKPQKRLETNVEELNEIQARLEAENRALEEQLQKLQPITHSAIDMVGSANSAVEATSSNFHSLNEILQAEVVQHSVCKLAY